MEISVTTNINKKDIQIAVLKELEFRDEKEIESLVRFHAKILQEPKCNNKSYRHTYSLEFLRILKQTIKPEFSNYVNIDTLLGYNIYLKILDDPNPANTVLASKGKLLAKEKEEVPIVNKPVGLGNLKFGFR